jgi:hypothetical protein
VTIAAATAAAATSVALTLVPPNRAVTFALAVQQTFGVVWLFWLGYSRQRGWVSATFVTAAAWAPLFLVPCWIYAINPSLLTTTASADQPLALVNISLFALITGLLVSRSPPAADTRFPRRDIAEVAGPSTRALVGFGGFGLLCLAILMARNGGPIAYITSQYRSGQLNSGLLYVVWGVLFLRFAPLAGAAARWAQGRPAGRLLWVYLLAGSTIVALMGAREFLASAAVEILLVGAIVRRRIRLRTLVAPVLVAGFLLVFGLGAVKFYQDYNVTHPGHRVSFIHYVIHIAPGHTVDHYVNNYVSGVSDIGLARRIVPAQAGYEYGKAVLQLLLKPIPSPYRPKLREARIISAWFGSNGGYAVAVPLQATAYLQFGIPGVIVAFALVGMLLAGIDRRLASPSTHRLPYLLVLITLAVQVPVLLRGGIPAGVVFLLMEVIGAWVAAILVAGGPGGLRKRVRNGLRASA